MRYSTLIIAITLLLAPVSASALSISDSPQFRYRAHRTRGFERPSHRSVERNTRSYRSRLAANRRGFVSNLKQIEAARDAIRNEYSATPDTGHTVGEQGYIPFNWFRTRRHVRHLYWKNHFQEVPDAQIGEGPAGQPDFEN